MGRTLGRSAALCLFLSSTAISAQGRVLRIVTPDGAPIPFATVWIEGGTGRLADTTGTVNIGHVRVGPVKVEARRMGFSPYKGTLTVVDTARVLTVELSATGTRLAAVTVMAAPLIPLGLQGYYRRALDRQKGAGSGWFIGPEEIERRQPNRATDVMRELPGVQFRRQVETGSVVAVDQFGCEATVVVDGAVVNPHPGKNPQSISPGQMAAAGGRWEPATAKNTVNIDSYVSPDGLAAVEFYRRGANVPMELQGNDMACGMLVIWTGGRKP